MLTFQVHPEKTITYKCDWEDCNYVNTVVTEIKKHRRQHLIDTKQLEK